MNLPRVHRIRQKIEAPHIDDVAATTKNALTCLPLDRIKPGDRVAITAGSRGITDIVLILKTIVTVLNSMQARPFLFPAMGSHGGATDQGQMDLLAHLGITAKTIGAPIKSSMETENIGTTADGLPVFMDKHAFTADHILVVNRIKSHSKFKAPIESGLMKMLAVGVGKQAGAAAYHQAGAAKSLPRTILDAARFLLIHTPVLGGVGIVENGFGKTARIAAMPADAMEAEEKALMIQAKKLAPKLPFDHLDLLIVDEMGKNISGVGMDPNVIGRSCEPPDLFPDHMHIKRLFVRDLTPQTNGNGLGIGLADITTHRLVDKIDFTAMYKNAVTSTSLAKAAVPIHFADDRTAIEVALQSLGLSSPDKIKLMRIKNTRDIEAMEVSETFGTAIKKRPDLTLLGGPRRMRFDTDGNLLDRD